MTIIYILLAIVIFGVLIAVHEFGHFTVAKLCGVKVEEFSIGMGPALFKKQRGDTLYALRCIPIGGYCAMTGEDNESEDPRAFLNQSWWKRLLILSAGSFMNFLLGLVVVLLLYSGASGFRSSIIEDFMEGCPYQSESAFQKGDRIIGIDGRRIYQVYDVSDFLSQNGSVHDVVVRRDGRRVTLEDIKLVPIDYDDGDDALYYGFQFAIEEATFQVKLSNAWNTTMEFGRWVWMGLDQLVSGQVGVKDLSGPVGIVDMMAETGEQAETTADALYGIFYLGAFIAVNLAIMNMLPIPALDGGRIFLLLVSSLIMLVTKKRLDPKYEGYVHAAGMILLLALMAFVMLNDIVKIVIK